MKLLTSVLTASMFGLFVQPAFAEKLDSGLFTLYQLSSDGTNGYFEVCGHFNGDSGCFGDGNFDKLDRACAVMEGKSKQKGNVITREVYVFDKRSSSDSPALVNVYFRTDTFVGTFDTITFRLKKKIQAGIAGAPDANCFMAGSDAVIIVGTNAGQTAAKIGISDLKISQIRGIANVQSITADQRGYITVSFLNGTFETLDPSGSAQSEGGGTYKMANTRNAFTTNSASPRH